MVELDIIKFYFKVLEKKKKEIVNILVPLCIFVLFLSNQNTNELKLCLGSNESASKGCDINACKQMGGIV
jgi:hypothetical protein